MPLKYNAYAAGERETPAVMNLHENGKKDADKIRRHTKNTKNIRESIRKLSIEKRSLGGINIKRIIESGDSSEHIGLQGGFDRKILGVSKEVFPGLPELF